MLQLPVSPAPPSLFFLPRAPSSFSRYRRPPPAAADRYQPSCRRPLPTGAMVKKRKNKSEVKKSVTMEIIEQTEETTADEESEEPQERSSKKRKHDADMHKGKEKAGNRISKKKKTTHVRKRKNKSEVKKSVTMEIIEQTEETTADEESEKRHVDWTFHELKDALVGVGRRVLAYSFQDLMAMRGVCTQWRRLFEDVEMKSDGPAIPLEMTRGVFGMEFCDKMNDKMKDKIACKLPCPQSICDASDGIYIGVGFGWVLAVGEYACLFNPFHYEKQFRIPPPYPPNGNRGIKRAALSADPLETTAFELVIVWQPSFQFRGNQVNTYVTCWVGGSEKMVPIKMWGEAVVFRCDREGVKYEAIYAAGGDSTFREDKVFSSSGMNFGVGTDYFEDNKRPSNDRLTDATFVQKELKGVTEVTFVLGSCILDTICDVIFYRGHFYFVTDGSQILKLDCKKPCIGLGQRHFQREPAGIAYYHDSFLVATAFLTVDVHHNFLGYDQDLVETTQGDLLLLMRNDRFLAMDSPQLAKKYIRIDTVHTVCNNDWQYASGYSQSFFVGRNGALAVDPTTFGCIKPYEIYESEHVWIAPRVLRFNRKGISYGRRS